MIEKILIFFIKASIPIQLLLIILLLMVHHFFIAFIILLIYVIDIVIIMNNKKFSKYICYSLGIHLDSINNKCSRCNKHIITDKQGNWY